MKTKKVKDAFEFNYILAKVKLYLEIGPVKYRKDDFFHLPDKSWSRTDLKNIKSSFQQFLKGKGLTEDKPMTGIGISGFYKAMQTLHFGVVSQLASKVEGGMLDCMVFKHQMRQEMTITIFNLV